MKRGLQYLMSCLRLYTNVSYLLVIAVRLLWSFCESVRLESYNASSKVGVNLRLEGEHGRTAGGDLRHLVNLMRIYLLLTTSWGSRGRYPSNWNAGPYVQKSWLRKAALEQYLFATVGSVKRLKSVVMDAVNQKTKYLVRARYEESTCINNRHVGFR